MTELTAREVARKGGLATKAKHPDQFKKMALIRWACPKCGYTRWKTKEKGRAWQCRNPECGFMKEANA